MKKSVRTMLVACTLLLIPVTSKADLITVTTQPTDLNPGDQFRLIFVTGRSYINPYPKTISTYNNFVDFEANIHATIAALGHEWLATQPDTRHAGAPFYGISGVFTVPGTPAVPEPSTLVLLLTGGIGLACYRARRRKQT